MIQVVVASITALAAIAAAGVGVIGRKENRSDHGNVSHALQRLDGKVDKIGDGVDRVAENLLDHVTWEMEQKYQTPTQIRDAVELAIRQHEERRSGADRRTGNSGGFGGVDRRSGTDRRDSNERDI